MKIGFDSKRLFCNFTGLGNYSRTLVRNLCHFYPENDYFLYSSSVKDTDETNEFLDNPELNIRISEGGQFKSPDDPWGNRQFALANLQHQLGQLPIQ
jgi:hypothetical protein